MCCCCIVQRQRCLPILEDSFLKCLPDDLLFDQLVHFRHAAEEDHTHVYTAEEDKRLENSWKVQFNRQRKMVRRNNVQTSLKPSRSKKVCAENLKEQTSRYIPVSK